MGEAMGERTRWKVYTDICADCDEMGLLINDWSPNGVFIVTTHAEKTGRCECGCPFRKCGCVFGKPHFEHCDNWEPKRHLTVKEPIELKSGQHLDGRWF